MLWLVYESKRLDVKPRDKNKRLDIRPSSLRKKEKRGDRLPKENMRD